MKSIFLSSIIQEIRKLWHTTRTQCMKRIMTHEKSDMHKEIVDYEEMEVYFIGI